MTYTHKRIGENGVETPMELQQKTVGVFPFSAPNNSEAHATIPQRTTLYKREPNNK